MTTRTVNRDWRRWLDGITGSVLDRLLEPDCRLCCDPASRTGGLCQRCWRALPWHTGGCPRCADPRTPGRTCGLCLSQPPAFDAVWPAFAYDAEVAALVRRFKHGGDLSAGRLLADELAACLPSGLPETLVPVPLDRQRQRLRGFNQAGEIARRLPGTIRRDLVARRAERQPQQHLAAPQRHRNIRGAFRALGTLPPARVTIVDDVVTTGATIREIARCLNRAGVREISVCCLARA